MILERDVSYDNDYFVDKINGVGILLDDIIKSLNNLNARLGTRKNSHQGVDSSTCNLQDTVDSINIGN